MFSDLTNTSNNAVSLNNVKAYPSVNSPNDGGFNSEGNLRWLAKRFNTKPFITGNSQSQIESSFTSDGGAGNGVYILPGMISLDGYTIKFSAQENLDFDDDTSRTKYTTLNTQYLQRFAHTISNQGTSYRLSTELNDFVFQQYRTTEPDYQDSWDALDLTTETVIGYIKNTYTGTFFEQITVNTEDTQTFSDGYIQYENIIIPMNSGITQASTPEQIESIISGYSSDAVKCVASVATEDSVIVCYPVTISYRKVWKSSESSYVSTPCIYFTDIFGLTYKRGLCRSDSKTYPATNNVFINMTGNYFLSDGFGAGFSEDPPAFNDCNKITQPTQTLNYSSFYSSNQRQFDYSGSVSTAALSDLESITYNGDSLFTKITVSDIVSNIHSTGSFNQVNNVMEYYCLNLPESIRSSSEPQVAFITSEGGLCVDGMITGSNFGSTVDTTVVEGYLHWLKRKCATALGVQVEDVTIDILLGWGSFQNLYNTYIAPAMSCYINICYNALVQYANNSKSSVPDAKKIKSYGCGNALNEYLLNYPLQNVFLTDGDLDFTQNISYSGYVYNTDTSSFESVTKYNTIVYSKNVTSDSEKISHAVITNTASTLVPDTSGMGNSITAYNPASNSQSSTYFVHPCYIEDPINYFRRCCPTISTLLGRKIINDVPVFVLNGTTLEPSTVTISSNETANIATNLCVDNFLTPKPVSSHFDNPDVVSNLANFVAHLSTHENFCLTSTNHEQTATVANGMNLTWNEYTWYIETPLVIRLNKDTLGYLIGQDITNPGYYGGTDFCFLLPNEITDEDLLIALLTCSTSNVIQGFDIETSDRIYDTTSKYVKQRRETYLPIGKIYGNNFETFDDIMNGYVAGIESDVDEKIGAVNNTISNIQNDILNINSSINTCLKVVESGIIFISDDEEITSIPANSFVTVTKTAPYVAVQSPYSLMINQEIQNSDPSIGFKPGLTFEYYVSTDTLYQQTDSIVINIYNNTSSDVTDVRIRYRILSK